MARDVRRSPHLDAALDVRHDTEAENSGREGLRIRVPRRQLRPEEHSHWSASGRESARRSLGRRGPTYDVLVLAITRATRTVQVARPRGPGKRRQSLTLSASPESRTSGRRLGVLGHDQIGLKTPRAPQGARIRMPRSRHPLEPPTIPECLSARSRRRHPCSRRAPGDPAAAAEPSLDRLAESFRAAAER